MKPQPLLRLHPLDWHERALRDDNYDGQGKSQQQESDDSLRMLAVCGLVMVVSLVLANRGKNLVICEDQGYHMLLHKRQRAYEATGNVSSNKCHICKQWNGPDIVVNARGQARHRSCHAIDGQRRRSL